jgi:aspartate kinase
MSPENVQEAEQYGEQRSREFAGACAERAAEFQRPESTQPEARQNVVAFKFGGTSLLGAERMLHAAELVKQAARTSRVVVVVSAMKGVTDQLLALAKLVDAGHCSAAKRKADNLLRLHADVFAELQLAELDHQRVWHDLRLLGRDLLHEVSSPAPAGNEAHHDSLASFGERFSARLFAAALDACEVPAVPVTSSEFILTCDTFRDAKPDMEETRRRGRDVLQPLLESGVVPVVTGFVGATRDGRVTTLGRNSSDYSGAIIAHVVDADELVIWTDVDGVFTANPNESSEALLLHQLSYEEAHALAAAGAKVLHADVLPLAAETKMVVWVRNTFNPEFRGTRIGPSVGHPGQENSQRGAA